MDPTDAPPTPAPSLPDPPVSEPKAPGTDRFLLVLLALLNLGSLYTTVVGARQILPWPMSDVLGVTVQALLFFALAGFAARHAPVRRWIVIGVFTAASVYTSFFAYYEQLASSSLAGSQLDRARQAHARFVDEVWQPRVDELEGLERQAKAGFAQAELEGQAGLTTGQKGYGPKAREFADQARQTELAAADRRATLERLAPRFTPTPEDWTADQIYRFDLDSWQQAPDDWKGTVGVPARADYLDLDQEVALLTPFKKVQDGDGAALASLALALMVDGTALLLGSAVTARRRSVVHTVARSAAAMVAEVREGRTAVHQAWERPASQALSTSTPDGALTVGLTGAGSAFLAALYEAIHPETGALDAARLLHHDDPSWRLAARMVLDRLRDPDVGWIKVHDGRWKVVRYEAVTRWLADQIRDAHDRESRMEEVPERGVLRVGWPRNAA